jgi:hypothetical protein
LYLFFVVALNLITLIILPYFIKSNLSLSGE